MFSCFMRLSPKQRQWLWFVALWCCGLFSVFALSYVVRIAMGIESS